MHILRIALLGLAALVAIIPGLTTARPDVTVTRGDAGAGGSPSPPSGCCWSLGRAAACS